MDDFACVVCPFVEPRVAQLGTLTLDLEDCTLSERAAAASSKVRSYSFSHRAHWHGAAASLRGSFNREEAKPQEDHHGEPPSFSRRRVQSSMSISTVAGSEGSQSGDDSMTSITRRNSLRMEQRWSRARTSELREALELGLLSEFSTCSASLEDAERKSIMQCRDRFVSDTAVVKRLSGDYSKRRSSSSSCNDVFGWVSDTAVKKRLVIPEKAL